MLVSLRCGPHSQGTADGPFALPAEVVRPLRHPEHTPTGRESHGNRGLAALLRIRRRQKVLRASPKIAREATSALIQRLYPSHEIHPIADGCLDAANPPKGEVYAAVFPGLAIVCTRDAANDAPTHLPPHFVREAAGRTLYLHAMHSVVDFFADAIWEPGGTLRRSFSLSPDSGVIEDIVLPCRSRRSTWRATRSSSNSWRRTTTIRSASTRSTWRRSCWWATP
ncbi:DUF6928 family protein [Lentzea roselyniae]|uniref:DUF6928 family protein n=1 Tax=Lentzea roselyniae TaxID=531940 RepID=UPI003D1573D9